MVDDREVYECAWGLAGATDLPVLYDAVFLAVAQLRGATLCTADEALSRAAATLRLDFVPLLSSEPR